MPGCLHILEIHFCTIAIVLSIHFLFVFTAYIIEKLSCFEISGLSRFPEMPDMLKLEIVKIFFKYPFFKSYNRYF